MFGIFKKNPKHSIEVILDNLGACADGIVEAASASTDLEVALKGAATITPMLGESKRFFDLDVRPRSILSRYLIAFQEQDLMTMAEMTRSMAAALNQVSDIQQKGALIHFWFIGEG